MIGKYVYVNVILCLSLFFQSTEANFQLELVQVIFRHGDRTPSKAELFPKAPYNPIFDTMGHGQLTEVNIHYNILYLLSFTFTTIPKLFPILVLNHPTV
ncbi:hypothetical protein ANTPLA_LOCUS1868 [Anthophora plagiata]